jgi:hypothetical protein
MGIEDGGLGYTGEELTGMLIAGNDFNYVKTHAEAIASAGQYNIISCSSEALETGNANLRKCAAIDLVLGLEYYDGHSLNFYKTFNSSMQRVLKNFTTRGGALMVSGAYIGRDNMNSSDNKFLANTLKCEYAGRNMISTDYLNGMGTTIPYWRQLNEEHYAATSSDILQPVKPAYTALQYADGYGAGVAYQGSDYRSFVMGIPFECIKGEQKRAAIMNGILNFLLK